MWSFCGQSLSKAELVARQSRPPNIPRSSYKMSFEFQAPSTKKVHHKEKVLRIPVQKSNNIDPRPFKKRKREETETEIVAIEDRSERKRRKKEEKEKARQRAREEDIQLISPRQKSGSAITGTLAGEPKKAKMRKDEDARKVEEPPAMVSLSKS